MKRKAEQSNSKKVSQKTGLSKKDLEEYEEKILSSPKHYNDLVPVINSFKESSKSPEAVHLVGTGLLRIFGKLAKKGALKKTKSMSESQVKVVQWLNSKYDDYKLSLFNILSSSKDEAALITCVTILMKLLQMESNYLAPTADEFYFPKDIFDKLLVSLLHSDGEPEPALEHLVEEYLEQYDDLRYFYYQEIVEIVPEQITDPKLVSDRLIDMLISISNFPESDQDIDNFYLSQKTTKSSSKKNITRVSSHKNVFQKAWLAALRLPQTVDQYKAVMIVLHKRIIPRMNKPQLLMDFLTDAYTAGGSVALLALNGLFSLMQKYNLDYPNFFIKLYALFDDNIMHVKYRSRFFRLVDLFLTSLMLPAATMASFIKRMARLALHAPPSAVIAIIPFIYNQLKRHPTCMKMIHNPAPAKEEGQDYDLFDNTQTDPSKTNALESSLWELETLQTHYHPNVSALARIMSQPFRKPQYPLEDFLDHSYKYLLDSEFGKTIKGQKVPLEYENSYLFVDADNTEDAPETLRLIKGFTL